MTELGANRYGKSGIRLVKVVRGPDRHQVRDLTVAIAGQILAGKNSRKR